MISRKLFAGSIVFFAFFTVYVGLVSPALAIDNESSYVELGSDYLVTDNTMTGQVILETSFTLDSYKYVFFESDGRFFPYQQAGLATVEIRFDGNRVSNASILDFRVLYPEQHSFNAIGAEVVDELPFVVVGIAVDDFDSFVFIFACDSGDASAAKRSLLLPRLLP